MQVIKETLVGVCDTFSLTALMKPKGATAVCSGGAGRWLLLLAAAVALSTQLPLASAVDDDLVVSKEFLAQIKQQFMEFQKQNGKGLPAGKGGACRHYCRSVSCPVREPNCKHTTTTTTTITTTTLTLLTAL
jgi:hypothetical protein